MVIMRSICHLIQSTTLKFKAYHKAYTTLYLIMWPINMHIYTKRVINKYFLLVYTLHLIPQKLSTGGEQITKGPEKSQKLDFVESSKSTANNKQNKGHFIFSII